jgi:hypothetical protein
MSSLTCPDRPFAGRRGVRLVEALTSPDRISLVACRVVGREPAFGRQHAHCSPHLAAPRFAAFSGEAGNGPREANCATWFVQLVHQRTRRYCLIFAN